MWASSNLGADAFLLVYDITNLQSLENLEGFVGMIEQETEIREETYRRELWDRERGRGRKGNAGLGNNNKDADGGKEKGFVKPVMIVAGNKCDLQSQRQVSARTGLEWARSRNYGFMETSARATVNIEETFALIVRRVVEARRRAEMDVGVAVNETEELIGARRTRPLTPLERREVVSEGTSEKVDKKVEGKRKRHWRESLKSAWRKFKCRA